MPLLVEFGGIKITMHFIQHEHNPPHIHCEYNGEKCLINLNNLSVMEGRIPRKQLKKALKWTYKNQLMLLFMWQNQEFKSLPPL